MCLAEIAGPGIALPLSARRITTMSFCALLFSVTALTHISAYAQGRNSRRPPRVHPSVVLVPSPPAGEESPATRALIDQQKARMSRRRRRGPEMPQRMGVRKHTAPAATVTADQMRALAYSLFMDALSERLQNSRWLVPAPRPAVGTTPPSRPTIVVSTHLVDVTVRTGADREVSTRFAVEDPTSPDPSAPRPPRQFEVVGVAVAGHLMLKSDYSTPLPDQVREAATRAAAEVSHALRTGEIPPIEQGGVRIALTPVAAPRTADALIFSSAGRIVEPKAIDGLPADVSDRFRPNIRPLSGDRVVQGDAVRAAMAAGSLLWEPRGAPDIAAVRELGRRLHVDYVLLSRVADVEFEVGPPEPSSLLSALDPTEPRPGVVSANPRKPSPEDPAVAWRLRVGRAGVIERDARAESIGALVRVSDGAVLWSTHAEETMSIRSTDPPRMAHEPDTRICTDAEQFSLLQLQRLFAAYRAGFQK